MLIIDDQQVPGSPLPKMMVSSPSTPTLSSKNQFVMVTTPADVMAWPFARAVGRAIWPQGGEFIYWTEHDYIEDLVTLQKLSDRARSDDGVWKDYIEWERQFFLCKNHPRLLFDRAFVAYSQFQRYEVYDFLSYRENQQLSTILAATIADYQSTSATLKGLADRFVSIEIAPEGTWPNGKR